MLSVDSVASELGLTRSGRRRLGPCPVCKGQRTRKDRRAPISYNGGAWKCWACGASGDAVNLVSYVISGAPKCYAEAFAWLADRQLVERRQDQEEPSPAPTRPPPAEVRDMWERAGSPGDYPPVVSFLASRKLSLSVPARVTGWSPDWWPIRWWPLIVPAYNGHGDLVSIHGRAVRAEAPRKTTWPRGYDAAGLLFADPDLGLPFLRRQAAPEVVVIVEGMTDYLSACGRGVAVLGITSGAAQALRLVQWGSARVVAAVDPDKAGMAYLEQIAEAIAPHPLRRVDFAGVA